MNHLESLTGICVVIPAAGVGVRMGASVPKQYIEVVGKTILEHTVSRLLALGPHRLIIAISLEDDHYKDLPVINQCEIVIGGTERGESVLNGLNKLNLRDDEWVMVHDAVRPCVRTADILSLCDKVRGTDVGGLLGIPVTDTIKKTSENIVVETVDRSDMWRAQTPQLFRFGILLRALRNATHITDEASAVEQLGYHPIMVPGHSDNIKVTTSDDLALVEHYLCRGKVS
jgi:2-C-methyl-D-erythritol 4-phosphate cytidylyltransferase